MADVTGVNVVCCRFKADLCKSHCIICCFK